MSNTVWTPVAGGASIAAAQPGLVKVSSDDTVASDLEAKLLAGVGITFTTQNGGANETRTIALDPAAYVPATGGTFTGDLTLSATGTESSILEMGHGRTDNGYAIIDLIGDTTYSDYGFRFIRNNSGPNADSRLLHRGTGSLDLVAREAGSLRCYTSNAERMRIDSSGNVGIGTSSPDSALHVYKQTNDRTARFQRISTQTLDIIQTASENQITSNGKPFMISTGDAQPMSFLTAGTERMRINSAGRVGIGTSSPDAAVTAIGSSTISSQVNVAARIGPNVTSDLLLGSINGNSPFVASQGSYPLTFNTNAVERMRIDSAGNVLIGTTNATTDLGYQRKLKIAGSGPALILEETDESQSYALFVGSGNLSIRDATSSNARMLIDSNGNVGIGTSLPGYKLDVNGTVNVTAIRFPDGTTMTTAA